MPGLEGIQITAGDTGKCSPAVQAREIGPSDFEDHTAFSAVSK